MIVDFPGEMMDRVEVELVELVDVFQIVWVIFVDVINVVVMIDFVNYVFDFGEVVVLMNNVGIVLLIGSWENSENWW